VDPGWNGAGWVEVEYGISGNVASFTVHGQCHDNGALECSDSTGTLTSRIGHFRANCACAEEQHYRYRWDELNRLVEGLRYDRATGGSWTYGARMRYRYDGANQRTVKQSFAATDVNTPERHALYVYAEFERRGLVIGVMNSNGPTYLATASTGDATETQYLIADARIVWDGEPSIAGTDIDRNRRVTVNASDLLDTITASIDIESGTLVEVSTYYPNGARENLWANEADVPLEPMGFTGKEADEEIGVTYFGERWLIPRLGRWATPDPLHVHAAGGEEVLNSFHYVSGNLLQATDPTGLQQRPEMCTEPNFAPPPTASERAGAVAGERAAVGEAGAAVANMYGIEPTMSAAHMTPQHLALFRAAQALGALGWVETPRGEYHYSGAAVTGYWAPRPWQGTGGEEFDRAFSTAYDNVMDSVPQDVWEATHPQQVSALETLTARLGSLLVSSAEAQPPDTATTGARGEAIARGILEDVGFRDIVAIQNDSGNGFDIVARYGRRIIVAEVKSSRRDVFRGLSELQVDFRSALRRILEQAQTDRYPAAQRAAAARLERQIAARGGRVAGIYIGVANVRSGNAIQVSIERWTRQGRAAPVIRGTRAAATVELRRHLQRARRARRR
jgi:RHS repeat-associated protein